MAERIKQEMFGDIQIWFNPDTSKFEADQGTNQYGERRVIVAPSIAAMIQKLSRAEREVPGMLVGDPGYYAPGKPSLETIVGVTRRSIRIKAPTFTHGFRSLSDYEEIYEPNLAVMEELNELIAAMGLLRAQYEALVRSLTRITPQKALTMLRAPAPAKEGSGDGDE